MPDSGAPHVTRRDFIHVAASTATAAMLARPSALSFMRRLQMFAASLPGLLSQIQPRGKEPANTLQSHSLRHPATVE